MTILNYVELGDSAQQTIVIIHGLFGSNKNWSRIIKQLASNFHVIAVDCRNHGDSFNDPSMSYKDMSDDIFNLLTHLGIKKTILIGHSMGGKIAMQFSNQYTDYVKKLIVVDMAPIQYNHDYVDLIEPFKTLDLATITSRKHADDLIKVKVSNDFLRTFLMQSLSKENDEWYWKNAWQNIEDNMSSLVSSPQLKEAQGIACLFVFGEQSNYYTEQGIEKVKTYFPKAQIKTVENGNHWLHYLQAEQFLDIVNQYLDHHQKRSIFPRRG